MELITAQNLTLAYDGRIAADRVSFTLPKGGYLCVIGENGSGKSTLLKCITGSVSPVGGTLSLAPELTKNGIGYLPQQSKIQHDFAAAVREVVLSGCIRRNPLGLTWNRACRERAAEAMEMLGIAPLANRSFGELSGGQRQRVLLARAMCASDMLLLLDEPVTGLDPDAAHEMYEAIRTVNKERGCAVMMVSHDVPCALREAELVLSLCSGHSFFGSVDGYLIHEQRDEEVDRERHHHHGEEHVHDTH